MGLWEFEEAAAVAKVTELYRHTPRRQVIQDFLESGQLQQGERFVGFVGLGKVTEHALQEQGRRRANEFDEPGGSFQRRHQFMPVLILRCTGMRRRLTQDGCCLTHPAHHATVRS